MKRKRFSEAQIIEVLQKAEAGVKKQDLCWGEGQIHSIRTEIT